MWLESHICIANVDKTHCGQDLCELKNIQSIQALKMTLLNSKTGSQPETFGVFKQKLGKQHSWGFKQHFGSSPTINQEQKSGDKKENKLAKNCSKEEGDNANVDVKRGFVPSDVNDPTKREFLSQLSKRIFTEQRTQNLFSKLRVVIQEMREIFIKFSSSSVLYFSTDQWNILNRHILIYSILFCITFWHSMGLDSVR